MRYASSSAALATAFFSIGSIPSVLGHGFLASFDVLRQNGNNQFHNTFQYFNQDTTTPVRMTDYLVPNYDVNSREIACGKNARFSSGIAEVSPGDTVAWGWRTDFDKVWTHHEGWSRTYIASCGGPGSCANVDETTLEWNKFAEKPQNPDRSWPVKELNQNGGGKWTDVIPQVPNGDYLLRSELVAMHYSVKRVQRNGDGSMVVEDGHSWGMEWYPSCAAIRVVNGGGEFPSQVVKFPGAYTEDSQGIFNPDLFSGNFVHTMPTLNTFTRSGGNPANDNPAPVVTSPPPAQEQPSNNNNNNNGGNDAVVAPIENTTPTNDNNNNDGGSTGGSGGGAGGTTNNVSTNPNPSTGINNPLCKVVRRKRSLRKRADRAKRLGRRHTHKLFRRSMDDQ